MSDIRDLKEFFVLSADGLTASFTKQLERKDYNTIAKAFKAVEGQWSKRENAFTFQYDATDELNEIFTTGKIPKRNPLQLFPTPRQQVIDAITSSDLAKAKLYASNERTVRMLEPSIGRLGIASVVRELYPSVVIQGVELDEINVKLARKAGYDVEHCDFLEYAVPENEDDRFDIVIMNPPFMGRGFIKHMLHAQKMLKKGGVLISIMPYEWMSSVSSKQESEFLNEITHTSTVLDGAYPKGTYEGTDCITTIAEMIHPDDYQALKVSNKDYWIEAATLEAENDYTFIQNYKKCKNEEQRNELIKQATLEYRNKFKYPSIVEWNHEFHHEIKTSLSECGELDEEIEINTTKQPIQVTTQDAPADTSFDVAMTLLAQISETVNNIETRCKPQNEAIKDMQIKIATSNPVEITTRRINMGAFGVCVLGNTMRKAS